MTVELHAAIRASQVGSWADCGARAQYHVQRGAPPQDRPHVGTVVGTLVHRMMLEHRGAVDADLPRFVEWDAHTRNKRELMDQVSFFAGVGNGEASRRGWRLGHTEVEMKGVLYEAGVRLQVSGHMDGTLTKREKLATFELKTGAHQPRSSWLQTGVYCWLWGQENEEPLAASVVLWVNRKSGTAKWEERDPAMLAAAGLHELQAICRDKMHGPRYNPSSLSCSSCLNDECSVRYVEPSVRLET